MAVADVVRRHGHNVGSGGGVIDFTVTDDTAIAHQLDEDPVPTAIVRWRIADDESFDVRDFHGSLDPLPLFEYDHIAQGPAILDGSDGVIDILQRISTGNQLIQLQAPLLIQIHQHGDVDGDTGGAHL